MTIRIQFRTGTMISTPALLTISACSSTGFSAGAPGEHIPQSYETITSTAAVTSTLGGSAIVVASETALADVGVTSVATSGSATHNTGRIELDDGTYLFIDPDGFNIDGEVSDGAGAAGTRLDVPIGAQPAYFTGGYAYVIPYSIDYQDGAVNHSSAGVAGQITASDDMPTGGSAVYSGESSVFQAGAGVGYNYDGGESTVSVDFGAGTVDVLMDNFTEVTSGGLVVALADAPFDQIHGAGLLINGAHFTGGNWVTLKGGAVVEVTGANTVTTSNGTFFGYDSSLSAPDEVGGVMSVLGDSGFVLGIYIAD